MVGTRPRLTADELARVLERGWGIRGELVPLPSERDQNTRVDVDGRPSFVLKVANPAEDPAFLDAQEAVLHRLVAAGLPVGRSLPPHGGTVTVDIAGRPARVRLVEWLAGRPVAAVERRPADLPRALGELTGQVTAALDGFRHPGADRPFQWDVRRAVETIATGLPAVADPRRQEILARTLARLDAARPAIDRLRRSVIHNDANDHNVLLDEAGRISGLLDLGDLVWSVTAAEPVVAATYLIEGGADPAKVIGDVLAGFETVVPLRPDERAAIPDLLLARVGISVAISAHQATLDPDPYLRVSEDGMWTLLTRLDP